MKLLFVWTFLYVSGISMQCIYYKLLLISHIVFIVFYIHFDSDFSWFFDDLIYQI